MKQFLLLALVGLATACDSGSSGGGTNNKEGNQCKLDGSWLGCQTDGTDSQSVALNIVGGMINEEIKQYPGTTNCTGTVSQTMSFQIAIQTLAAGQSTYVVGGTDATLTPQNGVDLGCGAGQEFYVTLKFANECGQLQATQPACVRSNTPSEVDPTAYIKQ